MNPPMFSGGLNPRGRVSSSFFFWGGGGHDGRRFFATALFWGLGAWSSKFLAVPSGSKYPWHEDGGVADNHGIIGPFGEGF